MFAPVETLKLKVAPDRPESTKLPASRFPDTADIYLCDACGRNLTKRLRRAYTHTWTPLGPPRIHCRCGEGFLSGSVEWDYLQPADRSRRARDIAILGLAVFGSIVGIGALLYAALRQHTSVFIMALSAFCLIAAVPFLISLTYLAEIPRVAASIWRTRGPQSGRR